MHLEVHRQISRKQCFENGSGTIAPEENCPPTPKLTLTLTETATLTGGQFSSGAIVRIPSKIIVPDVIKHANF